MPDVPDYLTVADAAAKLKAHPRTILRLIKKGRLPAKNIGVGKHAEFRIDPADLAKLDFDALAGKFPTPPPKPRQRKPTFRRLVGRPD
jgi:excisionase family DNA binding protein